MKLAPHIDRKTDPLLREDLRKCLAGDAAKRFAGAADLSTQLRALEKRRAEHAAPLAYICGSLGTLFGADLLNLDKVQGLGAPVASIGGAGTFDGVFLVGIVAVLIASFRRRPQPAPAVPQPHLTKLR